MISQKRKKTNSRNTYKPKRKYKRKKSQPLKNGSLHGFFSLIGYILSMVILIAMFIVLLIPVITKTPKENNYKFTQKQLKIALKNQEFKGVNYAK